MSGSKSAIGPAPDKAGRRWMARLLSTRTAAWTSGSAGASPSLLVYLTQIRNGVALRLISESLRLTL